jgi:hypothetical protein
MRRIAQQPEELEKELIDQLDLLQKLTELYDQGTKTTAKPMATCLRVLLHDKNRSHSLLGQLKLKNNDFLSTCEATIDLPSNQVRAGTFSGLIGINSEGGYVPYLDEMPGGKPRKVNFNDFWCETIFIDQQHNKFSRKDIVLFVAEQDGGAHVDPGLDENYVELARNNSLGWMAGTANEWKPLEDAHLAAIRQISHEVLKTFVSNYEVVKPETNGITIGGGGFVLTYKDDNVGSTRKVGRNEPCPCGSKVKYKRCHGKP